MLVDCEYQGVNEQMTSGTLCDMTGGRTRVKFVTVIGHGGR